MLRTQLEGPVGTMGQNGPIRPSMVPTINAPLNPGQINATRGPTVNMSGIVNNGNVPQMGQSQPQTSMLLDQLREPPSSDPNPSVINSVSF